MKKFIILGMVFLLSSTLLAQTVRDFRLGVWAAFPWVNPNPAEQDYVAEINLNHITAWILNTNPQLYPAEYDSAYPNFDPTHIRWLERKWMDYFNSTYANSENVGMYIGYNGHANITQFNSQIEAYTYPYSSWNNFVNVVSTYYNEFHNDAGLQGYLVSHEDLRKGNDNYSHQPRITAMLQHIRSIEIDPNHELVVLDYRLNDPIVRDWLINNRNLMDVFEFDLYVIELNTPYAGTAFQSRLDYLISFQDHCKNIFAGSNTDWHYIMQTYANLGTGLGPDDGFSEQTLLERRWPTKTEIWVQAYLALTRGARGIKCFMYGSTGNLEGLLLNQFHPITKQRPKRIIQIGGIELEPFDFVGSLFDTLQVLGPVFSQLEVEDAYLASGEVSLPPDPFVNVTAGDYIEAGVFNHRINPDPDNEKYVLLVNRVCSNSDGSPAPPQTITVEIPSAQHKRVVEDIYKTRTPGNNDACLVLESNQNTFQITLKPGEGRLFRISNGLHGNIPAEDYYLSGEVYVNGDLVAPNNYKLTIEPFTTVIIAPYSDEENDGSYPNLTEVIVKDNGQLKIDNAQVTTGTSSGPNQWGGIFYTFSGDAPRYNDFEILNSTIEYAATAITINSPAAQDFKDYRILSNNILHSATGIEVLNFQGSGSLTIQTNYIAHCDIGLEFQHSAGLINSNGIFDCDFSIICSEWSTPVIRGNSISAPNNQANQYGLYCLNNSSPYVNNNSDDPNLSGGENVFTDCLYGVLAEDNSYPNLGEFSEEHEFDGKNYIYDNSVDVANQNDDQELPVYAVYNYWGNIPGTVPPPDSIVGNVEYKPWLVVPPPSEGESGTASGSGGIAPEYDAYLQAISEEDAGNLSAAYTGYQNIISNYPNSPVNQLTIAGIIRVLQTQGQL